MDRKNRKKEKNARDDKIERVAKNTYNKRLVEVREGRRKGLKTKQEGTE